MIEQFIKGACDELDLDESSLSEKGRAFLKQAFEALPTPPRKKTNYLPWIVGGLGLGAAGLGMYGAVKHLGAKPAPVPVTPPPSHAEFESFLRESNQGLQPQPSLGPTLENADAQDGARAFVKSLGVNSADYHRPSALERGAGFLKGIGGNTDLAAAAWKGTTGHPALDALGATATSLTDIFGNIASGRFLTGGLKGNAVMGSRMVAPMLMQRTDAYRPSSLVQSHAWENQVPAASAESAGKGMLRSLALAGKGALTGASIQGYQSRLAVEAIPYAKQFGQLVNDMRTQGTTPELQNRMHQFWRTYAQSDPEFRNNIQWALGKLQQDPRMGMTHLPLAETFKSYYQQLEAGTR